MSALRPLHAALCALALLASPLMAGATDPAGQDSARIAGSAGSDMRGRAAVNQAAGSGNTQANLAGIALSAAGPGLVDLRARQHPSAVGDRSRAARARIDDRAFAGTRGVLSLNQAAGSGNGQLNLFAAGGHIAGVLAGADITGLDDAALAAVAGEPISESTETTPPIREAGIADGAFRGSQGVVQVNQTAGVGNLSTNAIVLQLPPSTP